MGTDRQEEDPTPTCAVASSPQRPILSPKHNAVGAQGVAEIDLDAWRGDLHRLHASIDQVVKSFIFNQTRQLDAVATELASQQERILVKERCFVDLGDSIASFVESEAVRTELWGLPLDNAEADALHESYDADLPGPPALHRINRLWRKMTRAFDVMKEAKEREASKTIQDERVQLEACIAAVEGRCEILQSEHGAEVDKLKQELAHARKDCQNKDSDIQNLSAELHTVTERHESSEAKLFEMVKQLEQTGFAHNRAGYEWEVEREELVRERFAAQASVAELQDSIEQSRKKEDDLVRQCAESREKMEQMKKIMDEQERDMTIKIDRVQHYVKERQAGALVAEKKQLDAERLAERWQREVQRLQNEKDRLANIVLELETHKSGQSKQMQGTNDLHQQEMERLHAALQQKEEEMRAANTELLEKRDAEYQSKLALERQREKDRSIALLNKKQQEMQVKEQQLKAARQRIQELESSSPNGLNTASPGSRGHSASRRSSGDVHDANLPPLPQSAR
jgi:hypothetical protein